MQSLHGECTVLLMIVVLQTSGDLIILYGGVLELENSPTNISMHNDDHNNWIEGIGKVSSQHI